MDQDGFLFESVDTGNLRNFLIRLWLSKGLAFRALTLRWYFTNGRLSDVVGFVPCAFIHWTFTRLILDFLKFLCNGGRLGIFINDFPLFNRLNFIVTIHTMRSRGMTCLECRFCLAHYATSLVMLLGTPVIAVTIMLLALERLARVGIFDPAIGGDPILFQHLFWFYSHPAVYIMVLPGMGVISELISNFSRKKIFGYEFIAFSSIAIAVFGFLVWGIYVVSGSRLRGRVFHF